MHDNIGGKIKVLAKGLFIAVTIATVTTGIALMAISKKYLSYGLLVMILGPIIAWISSLMLYGFGQLIENSDTIAEEYKRINTTAEKKEVTRQKKNRDKEYHKTKKKISDPQFFTENYIDIKCPECDKLLSFAQDEFNNNDNLFCPYCGAVVSTSINR